MKRKKRQKRIILGIFLGLSFILITGATTRLYHYGRSLYAKIELFSEIIVKIKNEYVEEKDPQELIEDAIKGVVSGLDPHTTYLSAEYFKQWNQNYEGYSGIGVTFDIVKNKITIMSVFDDGPSDKVGLMAGDRIIAIAGKSAIGMKRDEVPLTLMGPRGTKVEVTIERRGWDKGRNFIITRDRVHVKSIPYAFMINTGTGYIGIIRFSSTTGEELREALQKLETQGMKQLILDLRGNGGGRLDAAVDVVDKFLPRNKRIVYTKGRVRGSYREFFSTDRSTHPIQPLIVLLNRASASGSEIVAGAMQDWDRGLILGETSFGKGLVQRQYPFKDGSALFMTTARYYTPSGRLIQRSYDDKSLEEYYLEVANDSLGRVEGIDDSRPSFKTLILGRQVYGGGGITPDAFIPSDNDTLTTIVRKIVTSPHRLLYTYSEEYVKNHPELGKDTNYFIRNYQPNGRILQQFLAHIRNSGLKITNEEFLRNKRDIQYYLKQSIAAEIWGDEARYKVRMLRDKQFLEALKYFPQAQKLLTRAYHIRNTG